jgi:beta-lactamase class D
LKRHIITLLILPLLVFTAPALGQEWEESIRINKIFTDYHVLGTFVLYDVSFDTFIGHNKKRAETRFIPASTFKIFNALIGLSVESVKNVDDILPWGGKPQPVKAWEKDMSLREAIIISAIPIYQELARRTGIERMRDKISEIGYGNGEIGDVVDRFWLDGPLKISAVEQACLLAKLSQNELPLSYEIQAEVRDIIKLEEGPDWTLYGKTGTAATYEPQVGWWVGWVKKSGQIYTFALNLDMASTEDAPKRMEVGKACLRALGLL